MPTEHSPEVNAASNVTCAVLVLMFLGMIIFCCLLGKKGGNDYEYTPSSTGRDESTKPLYDDVQRRKAEQGISDREAVNQIVDEHEKSEGKK